MEHDRSDPASNELTELQKTGQSLTVARTPSGLSSGPLVCDSSLTAISARIKDAMTTAATKIPPRWKVMLWERNSIEPAMLRSAQSDCS